MSVPENLKLVMDRIAAAATRAGRDPSSIRLVTVTKTVSLDRIREAVAAGASLLGENRVQEAKEKIEALGPIAHWHLIGHLQTNKAKYAVRLFDLIHSVDNIELAAELDRQAPKAGKAQDVLVEVNIAGEAQKAGVALTDAAELVRETAKLKNLRIRGLMTMPPYAEDPEASRPHYRRLRELAAAIAEENIAGVSMAELSMGMSGDFEVAVEEGATLVRVGTAVFGGRG
jgi:pyridoxal phosphate enzyme (YggS family)